MNLKNWIQKINDKRLKKDNFVILLLVGILLMVVFIPIDKPKKAKTSIDTNASVQDSQASSANDQYEKELEERLRLTLSKVSGVGQVEVMITLRASKEVIIEKDTPGKSTSTTETDGDGGSRTVLERETNETTVYQQDSNGYKAPYVVKQMEPEIEGILVIAQGGDNPVVAKNITEAVMALFNVEAHKIKVMKMD